MSPSQTQPQSIPVPAKPPTRLEIERKLSFKSPAPSPVSIDSPTRRQTRRSSGALPPSTQLPPPVPTSGNESDSSIASSSFIPSASPVIAPHGAGVNAAGLSAIEERELGNDLNDLEGDDEDDGSEDEDAGISLGGELRRGVEGERVVKSGYLSKKQERRKNWKKRWFVLRTGKLAYYKDDKEYLLCRIIDLHTVHTVAQVTVKKHPFAFGIVTSKRTFYAKAASQAEMEDWVKSINDARKALAAADHEASSTAPSSSFQPGTYTSQASFSGYSTSPSFGPGSYLSQHMPNPTVASPSVQTGTGTGGALPPLAASFGRITVTTPNTRRDPSASSVSSHGGDYFATTPTAYQAQAVTSSDEDENDPGEFSDVIPSQPQRLPIQTDPKKVILSAYLMKRGKGRRNWRKRWFVLTSGALVYTKSHMDTRIHRSIPLASILDAIDFESDDDSEDERSLARSPLEVSAPSHSHAHAHGHVHQKTEHTFRVITPKRTFVLCAPTEEDEIKWLAALRALLNRERGVAAPTVGASAPAPLNVPVITQQPPSPAVSPAAQSQDATAGQPSQVYARARSATQSAKSAVADVVKRYHPETAS